MNEDNDVTLDHPGALELGERLEAFATARLAPNRASMSRVRSAVVEEARMRALEASLGRRRHRHGGLRSRTVAVFLAAGLTLAAAAAVSAGTTAGGPLYEARIWIEASLLPTEASARAEARIAQIERRLGEAERAAAAGDAGAVAAAVHAYQDAVEAALGEAGSHVDRLDRLEAALGLHVAVLEALSQSGPPGRAKGLERALQASQQAMDRIEQAQSGGKPDGQPGSGNSGSGNGNGSGGADGQGNRPVAPGQSQQSGGDD